MRLDVYIYIQQSSIISNRFLCAMSVKALGMLLILEGQRHSRLAFVCETSGTKLNDEEKLYHNMRESEKP